MLWVNVRKGDSNNKYGKSNHALQIHLIGLNIHYQRQFSVLVEIDGPNKSIEDAQNDLYIVDRRFPKGHFLDE